MVMNVAVIGCGYVADFYMATIGQYANLRVKTAFDVNDERLRAFSSAYGVRPVGSLEEVLDDGSIEMVFNLTNPRSHHHVTMSCLRAGKHVYSEKPLAMTYEAASELVQVANDQGVHLSCAPCSVLGETAQTIWKALREDTIGPVRLARGHFDTGMLSQCQPWLWKSATDAPWPAKDEFEVGCTYQHAGYLLSWLAAFFGPAVSVSAFASCQLPDKGIPLDVETPDFTAGCIRYEGGVVAQITNSIIAPTDRSLLLVGDKGTIYTNDVRDDASPVYVTKVPGNRLVGALEHRWNRNRNKLERALNSLPWAWGRTWQLRQRYPFARQPTPRRAWSGKPVDFCRGPADLAEAVTDGRAPRLSSELGLHVTELVEALQYPERFGGHKQMSSTFAPLCPLPCE